jgi:hypothetical protein
MTHYQLDMKIIVEFNLKRVEEGVGFQFYHYKNTVLSAFKRVFFSSLLNDYKVV